MSTLRSASVSLLCLAAAVCMRSWGGNLPWQLWLPTGLLAAAAILAHHRHTASQLLVRAVLWSNLLLGVVVAWAGNMGERPVAGAVAVTTGLAIFALGRRGLDGDAGGRFVPIAFHGTLVAILVMALADAQTLMLFGSLFLEEGREYGHSTGLAMLVLSLALSASIIGLYALRVWGLLVNALACAAVIVAVLTGALELPTLLKIAFLATATMQVVLAIPLYVAFFTGSTRRPPTLSRRSVWLGSITVAALMGAALWPAFTLFVLHQP